MIPVMNAALVWGVLLTHPRALGGAFWPWLVAAGGVALSLFLAPGVLAASALVPWLVLALAAGFDAARARDLWRVATAGFSVTAVLALVASRLEVTLFDIHEPIVKLTALHFTYAGAGTLSLARRLHEVRPSRWTSAARVLVLVAPPVVATGFIFKSAVGQVGGAVLMTLGVWLVAALQLEDVRTGPRRVLWVLSCASPVVAMVLGVSWAAAQYWPQVWALTVPDMVPTHGALNAFGFVTCAQLAPSSSLSPRGGEGRGEG